MPQYAYDWGYSKAYIELMCSDTTIIQYPESGKGNEAQEREKAAAEAKSLYLKKMAQKEKQNTQTIKLKD